MRGTLQICLKSDLCVGSGDRMDTVIDTEVCFDPNGLPYLPARRIKGILRENATDLLSAAFCDKYNQGDFECLFGEPGQAFSGALYCDNAYIEDHENYGDYVSQLESVFERHFHRSYLLRDMTSIRRQTAVGDDGVVRPQSLRSVRVINQYLASGEENVFFAAIELAPNVSESTKSLFEDAVAVMRHMGTNRTRGLGEVQVSCRWHSDETYSEKRNSDTALGNEYDSCEMRYILRLLAPLITGEMGGAASDIHDYIPGSMILGCFAGAWLRNHRDVGNHAHEDEQFRDLFLSQSVSFGNAQIVRDGIPYVRIPQNILRSKDKTSIYNGLTASDDPRPEMKYKHPKGYFAGGIIRSDSEIVLPQQKIYQHHSRPDNRAVGHATGKDGSKYFQYKALEKDQVFSGTIRGSRKELNRLQSLIDESGEIHIGRSKSAQYGRARITFEEITVRKAEHLTIQKGQNFAIYIDSDTIPRRSSGQPSSDPRVLLNELFPDQAKKLRIVSTWLSTRVCSGYKSHWRLPLPQYPAIEQSSVLLIQNLSDASISVAKEIVAGLRQSEGYGRISTRDPAEDIPEPDGLKERSNPSDKSKPVVTAERLEFIISKNRVLKNLFVDSVEAVAIEQAREAVAIDQARETKPTPDVSANTLSYIRTGIIRSRKAEDFGKWLSVKKNADSYQRIIHLLFEDARDAHNVSTILSFQQETIVKKSLPDPSLFQCLSDEDIFRVYRAATVARLTALRESIRMENNDKVRQTEVNG